MIELMSIEKNMDISNITEETARETIKLTFEVTIHLSPLKA
jgi:hypothetical protein